MTPEWIHHLRFDDQRTYIFQQGLPMDILAQMS